MAGDEKNTKGPAPFEVEHPEILDMIGTKPDAELAREFDVHPITIRAIRDRNGLTETRGRKLTEEKQPEILDAIGKNSDTDVADKFGVSTATVAAIRKRHGVELSMDLNRPTIQISPDPEEGWAIHIRKITPTGLIQTMVDKNGVKVFHREELDHMEAFDTWAECQAFMSDLDGAPCLLSLRAAREALPGMPFSFQDGGSVPATAATA